MRAINLFFFLLAVWREVAEVSTYQFWGENIDPLHRHRKIDLY